MPRELDMCHPWCALGSPARVPWPRAGCPISRTRAALFFPEREKKTQPSIPAVATGIMQSTCEGCGGVVQFPERAALPVGGQATRPLWLMVAHEWMPTAAAALVRGTSFCEQAADIQYFAADRLTGHAVALGFSVKPKIAKP